MSGWGAAVGAAVDAISSWHSGKKNREAVNHANESNADLQRSFAQQGIQWRVNDAKAAGLHPLYALGANISGASPSFTVGAGPDYSSMGQNISRAVDAATSAEEDRALKSAQLKVLEAQADKDFALAQSARSQDTRDWLQQWQARPTMGLDGTGVRADPFWALSTDYLPHAVRSDSAGSGFASGRVKTNPSERSANLPGNMSREAAAAPAYKDYFVSPSSDLQASAYASNEGYGEARENMGEVQFLLQNTSQRGLDWLIRYVNEVYLGNGPKFRQVPKGKESTLGGLKPRGWHNPYKRGSGRSE